MTPAKCPNPTCPFLFDPSQVPPGAVIACPRCGLRFTLPPPAPATIFPYGPPAPSAPADELGLLDVSPNTDDLPTEERPRPRRRRDEPAVEEGGGDAPHRKAGSGAGKVILFSVIGVLVICGVLAGYLYLKSQQPAKDLTPRRSPEVVLDNLRLAYTPPAGNWEVDDPLKLGFQASVRAMKSLDPPGWIVIDARSMAYTPQLAELRETVLATLAANGELKGVPAEEDAKLGGVDGKRYVFEALMTSGEEVKGEVYAVGYQRTAYFVYSFAPEKKVGDVAQAFVDFRASIRFTAKPAAGDQVGYSKTFRTKLGTYTLTATENLWRELADPMSQDDKADLLLRGDIKLAGGGSPDPATVLVLVLDKAGAPKAAAEEYLMKTLFDLPDNPPTLKELTDDFQGDDPPAGPPQPVAAVSRYEVRYANGGADSRKFVVVATLDGDKKRFAAVGYAVLKQRKSWEKRLVQIVGSLSPP